MEVDFARTEVHDDKVAKSLWEESDSLIERVEKAQARLRAAQKVENEQSDKDQAEKKRMTEVEGLVDAIRKGKEGQKRERAKSGATSEGIVKSKRGANKHSS